MDEKFVNILEARLKGCRLTPSQAVELWREAPLELLSKYALAAKREVSGDAIYYNRNIHIEPTNVCRFHCRFCSYRADAGSEKAWDLSLEEIFDIAKGYQGSAITEIHIVGGVHPERDLEHYLEMIQGVKQALPQVSIKAFTAIELADMITRAGLEYGEGLKRLKQAGMAAIPGGGAEIFDEELRREICPEKGSAELWLSLHEAAHAEGIPTNATMLYGHVESIEQRVDHLDRLRSQQDKSGGFDAFIPLKFRSEGNELGQLLDRVNLSDEDEDMRVAALSRLFLDNIPHIKSYWVMYGKGAAARSLAYGVDDIDGTIDDTTKIFSMAGSEEQRPSFTVQDMRAMVERSGFRAVERDTHYREIL